LAVVAYLAKRPGRTENEEEPSRPLLVSIVVGDSTTLTTASRGHQHRQPLTATHEAILDEKEQPSRREAT